jgi:hypothetical protein
MRPNGPNAFAARPSATSRPEPEEISHGLVDFCAIVRCAEPIGRRIGAECGSDAVRHLACGPVGERDGEHPMRRNAIDRKAVRDSGGEGRGFAGPCPGQDQDRARMSGGRDLGLCQGRGDRIERGGQRVGPLFE